MHPHDNLRGFEADGGLRVELSRVDGADLRPGDPSQTSQAPTRAPG